MNPTAHNRLEGYLRSLAIVLLVFVQSAVNGQGEDMREIARVKALELVDRYAADSRLVNSGGERLDGEFLALFGNNARVVTDYGGPQESENRVSPQRYVADFQAAWKTDLIFEIPVRTEVYRKKVKLQNLSSGKGYVVQIPVKRSFAMVLVDNELIRPDEDWEVFMMVHVTVKNQGSALISNIDHLGKGSMPSWSLDVLYPVSLSSPEIRESPQGAVAPEDVVTRFFSMSISYRFNPFPLSSGLSDQRLQFGVGLGFESFKIATPTLTSNTSVSDYLGSQDPVLNLLTGDLLNNQGMGAEDFVLTTQSTSGEEELNYTAPIFRFFADYAIRVTKSSVTSFGLGIGWVLGGKTSLDYRISNNQYAQFAEGVFAGNAVLINPSSVGYDGMFDEFIDDGTYGFQDSENESTFTIQLNSVPFVDFRLGHQLKMKAFEPGLFVSWRTDLRPRLDFSDISFNPENPGMVNTIDRYTLSSLSFGIIIEFKP
jgi:hypothetical protein